MPGPSFLKLPPLLMATACIGVAASADEPRPAATGTQASALQPVPTRHQLMKDCMAKQKAADSGKPTYELSQDCREIIKTERKNAEANRKLAPDKPPAS